MDGPRSTDFGVRRSDEARKRSGRRSFQGRGVYEAPVETRPAVAPCPAGRPVARPSVALALRNSTRHHGARDPEPFLPCHVSVGGRSSNCGESTWGAGRPEVGAAELVVIKGADLVGEAPRPGALKEMLGDFVSSALVRPCSNGWRGLPSYWR